METAFMKDETSKVSYDTESYSPRKNYVILEDLKNVHHQGLGNSCKLNYTESAIFFKCESHDHFIMDEKSKENHLGTPIECSEKTDSPKDDDKCDENFFDTKFDENDGPQDHSEKIDESVDLKEEDVELGDSKLGVIFASYERVTGVQVVCKKLSVYDIWQINSEMRVSGYHCATCGETFATNRALKQHNRYPCIDDDKPLLDEQVERSNYSNNRNIVDCSENAGRNSNTDITSSTTSDLNNIYDGNNDGQVTANRKNFNFKIRILPVNSPKPAGSRRKKVLTSDTFEKPEVHRRRKLSKSNVSTSLAGVQPKYGIKRELYKCPICDNLYSSSSLLNEHKETHTPEEEEKREKCDLCSARFRTSDELKKHVSEVHLKFKCELCEKSFPSEGNLFFHLKLAHKLTLPFKCEECGKGFSTRKILTSHVISSKCYACGKCLKMANDACSVHGKLVCDYCQKLFSLKSQLCSHIENHLPKKCPHCPKIFFERRKFRQHKRLHDRYTKARKIAEMKRMGKTPVDPIKPIIKPGEKINDNVPTSIVTSVSLRRAFFKCEVCASLFSTVSLLNRHTATHTVQST